MRKFKGNLFNLLEQSETYIKEHINWRAILEGRTREEIPEIPVRAITEAVVNSLCHRDYTNPKSNEIAIFKNRIEIYNPGQFPEGYEPEDFIKGEEKSILRNPLIANTLYLSSDIEKWGSGLKRIIDACREENVKVVFKKIKSGFVVVFYRPEIEGKEELVENGVERGHEKGVEKGVETLSEKEIIILSIIENSPSISKKKIQEKSKLGKKAIDYNIRKLKEKGIIKRIGPAKGGYWEIIGK